MDNFNLGSDESVIFKTQRLIIGGVRHEAILTSRRLILVETETGHVHEDIPFTNIELAVEGTNILREPVISLTIKPLEGDTRTIDLIFIHLSGDQNLLERNKCIRILTEHNVPINAEGRVDITDPVSPFVAAKPGVLAVDKSSGRPAAPEWLLIGSSGNTKHTLPEEPPERSPLTTIAAIILIVVVIIGGMTLMGQMLNAKTHPAPQNLTVTVVPTEVTTEPSPHQTMVPASDVTPVTAPSLSSISIPPSGIWVRVQYPGNFSGYIGSRGRNIEVGGSGTKWYPLSITDPVIDGSIEKLDGSADKMEVDVYKDGTLISRKITMAPRGLIELHMTGPEEITNDVVVNDVVTTPVPASRPESWVTDAYLPRITIPATGVWVRIYYPGSFTGSVGGHGTFTTVKSTGDRLYEMPVNVGIVEGSIEKDDGSVGKMVTEVYKDGVRVSRTVTTTPYGLIDLHVPV